MIVAIQHVSNWMFTGSLTFYLGNIGPLLTVLEPNLRSNGINLISIQGHPLSIYATAILLLIAAFFYVRLAKRRSLKLIQDERIKNEKLTKQMLNVLDERRALKGLLERKERYLTKAKIQLKLNHNLGKRILTQLKSQPNLDKRTYLNLSMSIKNELQMNTTLDREIEQLSNITYSETTRKLKHRFPHLSSNDIETCHLIISGWSNKEIAISKGVKPSSIKMAKNRLKKKMELKTSDNLSNYLLEVAI